MSAGQIGRVQAQFGRAVEAYVASAGHAGGADLEWLIARGRARGATRVLDVATGGGHTALAFGAFTPSVVATDVTEPMLGASRRLAASRGVPGVRFVAADVTALPFADAAFGVATCRLAAHHFAELLPALRQIARVLRPGGTLLVEDILGHEDPEAAAFMTEVERRRDPSHVRAFRHIEWVAFMRAAGLTVIDETTMAKARDWDDWTARAGMAKEGRQELDRFVLAAPQGARDAFDFVVEDGRVRSFTTRLVLLRADRD